MNKAFNKQSRMIKAVKREKALAEIRKQFHDVLGGQDIKFKIKDK